MHISDHNGSLHGTYFINLKVLETGDVVTVMNKEGGQFLCGLESMEAAGSCDNSAKDQGEDTILILLICENRWEMCLVGKCRLKNSDT